MGVVDPALDKRLQFAGEKYAWKPASLRLFIYPEHFLHPFNSHQRIDDGIDQLRTGHLDVDHPESIPPDEFRLIERILIFRSRLITSAILFTRPVASSAWIRTVATNAPFAAFCCQRAGNTR